MINFLFKPGKAILALFAICLVTPILYLFYLFSLPFFSLFEYDVFIYIFCPLVLILFVTMFLDKRYKTRLRQYVFAAFGVLAFCLLVYPSLQKWIMKDAEKKGDALFHAIHRYKA